MARGTKEALEWIVCILREHQISFQIAGGFAARVYGSRRKLADIDICVPDNCLEKILSAVKKYVIYGPQRYVDNNFDLPLMTLKYKGQEIDVCGNNSTKIYDSKNKKWVSNVSDFKTNIIKSVYGMNVPIIPKEDLIAYKKILGREVDIKDVEALTK